MKRIVNCPTCGEPFLARRKATVYCSPGCRPPSSIDPRLNLSATNTGAVGELLVAADLLRRGFAVYRSVSPSSPCDLIAQKDAALLRVEVTKGTRYRSGNTAFAPHQPNRRDLLAVWFADGEIRYDPPIG